MKCPWMYGKNAKQCAAVQGIVMVSTGEIQNYCENGNFEECPVYKARKDSNKIISFHEYYEAQSGFQRNLSG